MKKYRFKTKEEFIRDELWNDKYNCPDEWAWEGQMNKYLGVDVPDELNVHCNENEEFKYDGWLFQNTDYVLKEQQKYFDDLSQHIGRYIRALVDNPSSGHSVRKGDVGKIISNCQVDFLNHKAYYCKSALPEDYLGTRYELLPEDYSPEQETIPERISFYVKYTEEFTEDLYNALWEWSKKNSEFSPRNFAESYEELKRYKFYIFDNWTLNCHGIYGNDRIHKYSYGVDNNKQNCEEEYSIEQVKKLIGYKEHGVEFIPGKWYKLIDCENAYRKCSKIPVEDRLPYSELIGNSGYRCETGSSIDLTRIKLIEDLSEIQEYLPDGHPDKITSSEFKKGEYIVLIGKGQSTNSSNELIDKGFIQNHCYKVKENKSYLMVELDSSESTTNGWTCIPYNPNKFHKTRNWRYATQEEIDEYERRGKPYDVTELQKKELSMKEIQEECKKRFPIGCTFASTNGEANVLKDDSSTYAIVGQNIWAHYLAGSLYEAGKWATLVSLPEENITEIPEYIECTETQESYFIKGNIYKVIDSKNLASVRLVSNIELSQISAGTHLFCSMESYGKKYWKPSTKEAYEQQKPLTYESVSGCFPTDKNIFNYDEVSQYLSTAFDYWKNVPKFVEQEFDIYGPTPDIE